MDTQVQRVVQWREQKRQAGYQPLTVWLKAEVKHLIEDLASQRRQDLAEVISEAIQAYAEAHSTPAKPEYVDAPTVRRLVAEYVRDLGGQISQDLAAEAPRGSPQSPASSVLLPGEYGWRIQAIREAAPHLHRFTCATMARHLGTKPKTILKTLYQMANDGELIKKGTVYYWVDPTTPDE